MKDKRHFFILIAMTVLLCALAAAGCEKDGDDDDDDNNDDDSDDDEFVVLSVQPSTGSEAGGTSVIVYGKGFEDGATVSFGENEATGVTFTGDTQLNATTPAADVPGLVTVRVENPGGQYAELVNGFRYGEPGVEIDWCNLKWPEATATAADVATELIYGHVYVEGCTEEQGAACTALTGQVGHGPTGSDPSVAPESFTWTDADYNTDFYPEEGAEDYNNDEFMASITETDAGVYKYAYRFSGDGGSIWTYCDLWTGSDDGFQTDNMGTLTVTAGDDDDDDDDDDFTIGWCVLQHPPATTTQPGTPTENIYGRLYVEGCTEGDAQCMAVTGQLGWGATSVNPSTNPSQFNWITAGYNDQHTSDNDDEYQAQITPALVGTYAYAYRFSVNGGADWTYCDLAPGLTDGFSTDAMGELTVN